MPTSATNGHDARRARTREALLTSASELFETHGYDATTAAQIARHARVSERTFYMHFPMKEDLLFAHLRDYDALARHVAHETRSSDPIDRVHAALSALIDAASTDESVARQAAVRAQLGARGEIPRSLAGQLMNLAHGLAQSISTDTGAAIATVAPIVGAALGAVEGAGFEAALRTTDAAERREAMSRALDAALRGFRTAAMTEPR